MNEKKEIKISLTTFIVGIIAIVLLILVIVMGMYIATGNNKGQTKTEIQNVENSENVVNNQISKNEKADDKYDKIEESKITEVGVKWNSKINIKVETIKLEKSNDTEMNEKMYNYYFRDNYDTKVYVRNIAKINEKIENINKQIENINNYDIGYKIKYENNKLKICNTTGNSWWEASDLKSKMKINEYYEIKNAPENIEKVIFNFSDGNDCGAGLMLILDNEGNVYYVDIANEIENTDFKAYKVNGLKNIKNIIETEIGWEDGGGSVKTFAENTDGEIYTINIDYQEI